MLRNSLLLFLLLLGALSRLCAAVETVGATELPYQRYEADQAELGAGAVLREAPDYDPAKLASEASELRCVALPVAGAFVEWTITAPADGFALRFSLPDSTDGTGLEGALELLVNGQLRQTLSLSSRWAWQYFHDSEPVNTPGSRPRMRFDEMHLQLSTGFEVGDRLRLRRPASTAHELTLDFVELEAVPAPLPKPAGYISVLDHGANGGDETSDLEAFEAALGAAKAAGTGVYVPPGRFVLHDVWRIDGADGIGILGAGIWHSELYFSQKKIWGGISVNSNNLEIAHLYLDTVLDERFIDHQQAIYKAIYGWFGDGSHFHNLWITHFEAGCWVGAYSAAPVPVTTNLVFEYNRVRNCYADGINFSQGTSHSTVRQCNFRSNGDDAMAIWPSSVNGATEGHHNTFAYSTVEHNYRAGAVGIFGGHSHHVHHLLIVDGFAGSGIRLTEDFPGFHFENNQLIRIHDNKLVRCGTSDDLWGNERGAIEIRGGGVRNVQFENIEIVDAQRHAIQLNGGQGLLFENIVVDGSGADPHTDSNFTGPMGGAAVLQYQEGGSATFRNLILKNIEHDPPVQQELPGYQLEVENLIDRSQAFQNWRFERFELAQLGEGAISGPLADPDGDGWNNLLEYRFGREPLRGDAQSMAPQSTRIGDSDYLVLELTLPEGREDVELIPEYSADLLQWHDEPAYIERQESSNGDGTFAMLVRALQPIDTGGPGYLRFKVVDSVN